MDLRSADTTELIRIATGKSHRPPISKADANGELLRRLYAEQEPDSDWAQRVEKRLDAIREWIDRADEDRDELSDRIAEARMEDTGASPLPLEQVVDTVRHHAERAAELTERSLEEPAGSKARKDWIAAARIHVQTARALSVVVDHRRAER